MDSRYWLSSLLSYIGFAWCFPSLNLSSILNLWLNEVHHLLLLLSMLLTTLTLLRHLISFHLHCSPLLLQLLQVKYQLSDVTSILPPHHPPQLLWSFLAFLSFVVVSMLLLLLNYLNATRRCYPTTNYSIILRSSLAFLSSSFLYPFKVWLLLKVA